VEGEGGVTTGRRPDRVAAIEAVGMLVLILVYIWWVQPRLRIRSAWLALLAPVIVSHVRRGETLTGLGFRRTNLRACLVAMAPLLVALAAAVLALGAIFGTVRHVSPSRLAAFFVYYCVWGLFQQYALNGYFVNRIAAAAAGRGERFVATLAAASFAIVHAPNWFLVGVTFGTGYLCARYYLRYRNLFPLGLAHGLLGTVLFLAAPDDLSQHFYIGPRALEWQHKPR
jgi:hypothetical protein